MDTLTCIPGTTCSTMKSYCIKMRKSWFWGVLFSKVRYYFNTSEAFLDLYRYTIVLKTWNSARKCCLTNDRVFARTYSSSCNCVYFLWALLGLRALFKTAYLGWAPGWALASPSKTSIPFLSTFALLTDCLWEAVQILLFWWLCCNLSVILDVMEQYR